MKANTVETIRNEFRRLRGAGIFRGNTLEIQNASFKADERLIFGKQSDAYYKAEHMWYCTESRNVNDLFERYGKKIAIWDNISDPTGKINSNYGWAVFSEENHNQFNSCRDILKADPNSRRAVMYYTRPTMHKDGVANGMSDHMCTLAVQYFINGDRLDAHVSMRSSDAVFGYIYDLNWQRYVLGELCGDLDKDRGDVYWHAGSLHVYDTHYDLVV